jgi:hypothetical protein
MLSRRSLNETAEVCTRLRWRERSIGGWNGTIRCVSRARSTDAQKVAASTPEPDSTSLFTVSNKTWFTLSAPTC